MDNSSHPRRTSQVKGHRLYGRLVIEILKRRGTITFDELVSEMCNDVANSGLGNFHNDKNIRKRVYDVLSVLSAMGMAYKNGKNVTLTRHNPVETSNQNGELEQLEEEKQQLEESSKRKKEQLHDLLLKSIAYKSLLLTKKKNPDEPQTRIYLPFIVIKVKKGTKIKCDASSDKMQHLFTFDQPFEILDNMKVLQSMGLAFGLEKTNCTLEALAVISNKL